MLISPVDPSLMTAAQMSSNHAVAFAKQFTLIEASGLLELIIEIGQLSSRHQEHRQQRLEELQAERNEALEALAPLPLTDQQRSDKTTAIHQDYKMARRKMLQDHRMERADLQNRFTDLAEAFKGNLGKLMEAFSSFEAAAAVEAEEADDDSSDESSDDEE